MFPCAEEWIAYSLLPTIMACLSFLIDLLGMTLLHFPPMDCHPSATFSNLNSNSHSLLRTFFVINCRWILMAPLGEEVRGCSANSEDAGSQVKGKQQNHLFGNGESFIYSSQHPGCILTQGHHILTALSTLQSPSALPFGKTSPGPPTAPVARPSGRLLVG